MGVVAIVALGWTSGEFGPALISMFGESQ